jgi:transcriptional regulator with XRE-family HTH domain
MGRTIRVSIKNFLALNDEMMFVAGAPKTIFLPAGVYVRAVRSALRMRQQDVSDRSGVPQAHIARIEKGKNVRIDTLRRVFEAMFCDMLVLPVPRKRLSDAIGERRVEKPRRLGRSPWPDELRRGPSRKPSAKPRKKYPRPWPYDPERC